VIPNLSSKRSATIAVFQATYQAFFQEPMATDYPLSLPFETVPLKNHPVIQAAVDILQLTLPLSLPIVSRLLRSPYIGSAEPERFLHAQFDRWLRQENYLSILPFQLIQQSITHQCVNFAHRIKEWQNHYEREKHQLPSQWAKTFSKQLEIWGWPATLNIVPEEADALTQWKNLLSEFSSLDLIKGSISHSSALDHLLKLLESTQLPCQRSITAHSVHLIDPQHLIKGQYEKLWIMDINYAAYTPDRNALNPFIPSSLQYTQDTNNTSLKTILHHTDTAILSYSDGELLTRKWLDRPIQLIEPKDLSLRPYLPLQTQLAQAIQWEYFQDNFAPPLATKN
jgi:hypothetical protein